MKNTVWIAKVKNLKEPEDENVILCFKDKPTKSIVISEFLKTLFIKGYKGSYEESGIDVKQLNIVILKSELI